MSKARLVIAAVTVEGRTQADVARSYGVSKAWVSTLLKRWRNEGEAAFEPRSRRPHHSPTKTADTTTELVLTLRDTLTSNGLDAGADTLTWHLEHHHHIVISRATINRILTRAGRITPEPAKRPRSSYIRFQAEQPNETWQSDFTHYRLTNPDGTPGPDTEIITWLDDHSRYALNISAHDRITGQIVLATFRQAAHEHGHPASTLTDNGMVYTTRFAGGRGGRSALEHELRHHNITQKNSRPNHPTTCGKVERFQQTMKNWLRAQPAKPTTIAELQHLIDAFRTEYNTRRPHNSLPHRSPPHTAYTARPKATPITGQRTTHTHDRTRTDRVDESGAVSLRHNGKLHHIGIGRTHARTRVLILVHDLNIRIINAATGELLRELTLDPTRNYQPTGAPKGPTRTPRT